MGLYPACAHQFPDQSLCGGKLGHVRPGLHYQPTPGPSARPGGGEGGSPVALLPLDQSLFPLPSPPATGRVAPALPAAQLGPRHPGASPCPAYSLLEPWQHPGPTSSTSPSPSLKGGELLGPGPLSSSYDLDAGCPIASCQDYVPNHPLTFLLSCAFLAPHLPAHLSWGSEAPAINQHFTVFVTSQQNVSHLYHLDQGWQLTKLN